MIYALYIVAIFNVAMLSYFAFLTLANPKRAGGRATERASALAYSNAMRTIPLGLATVAAIAVGAREAFLWLASVGCVIQLLDSLPGQVKRDPNEMLRPFLIGIAQLVLLLFVFATSGAES